VHSPATGAGTGGLQAACATECTPGAKGRCRGNHVLAFYTWDAHWRHLANTTEPSVCGGDAAFSQITTTCYGRPMV